MLGRLQVKPDFVLCSLRYGVHMRCTNVQLVRFVFVFVFMFML